MKAALRPLRGALAVWQVLLLLALQLSDGSGVHACPAHDRVAPGGTHAGHHASGPAPGGSHGQHGPCTCLGACSGASLAGAPSQPVTLPVATATRVVDPTIVRLAPPRVAPRLLPFAVGPPAHA